MQYSKLFDLLKVLDQTKINKFCYFLNIFREKKDKTATKLFDIIYEEYPSLNSVKLQKQEVHLVLFPEKEYNEKRILNAMSDLLRLLEEFIAFQSARNNQYENQYALLKFFLEHDLNKQFEATFKELREMLSQAPEDADILAFAYKLEMLHVAYQLKYNKRSSNYQNSYNALNNFVVSQQKKLENLFHVNLYNDIDRQITDSRLAKIHLAINELLLDPENEKIYDKCKQLLIGNSKHIALKELEAATILLINYCIYRVNKKDVRFNQELIFWYNFMIEHNCILELNGTISSAIIKNYITISIRLNQIEEALSFLNTYASYIDEQEKEDVYNYNLANILFYQQKYEDALVLLTTAKYKDIFYKLSAKRLYVKIYFALSEENENRYFDVLESSLNAFKKYVYTSKELTENIRVRNKRFYKFAAKIANSHKGENAKVRQLYDEIIQDTQCADRDWLIDKVEKYL